MKSLINKTYLNKSRGRRQVILWEGETITSIKYALTNFSP